MAKLKAIAAKRLEQIAADILLRMHKNFIFKHFSRKYAGKALNKNEKTGAEGLCADFIDHAAFLLKLTGKLVEPSAGNQFSFDENTNAVANLLDLVKLM